MGRRTRASIASILCGALLLLCLPGAATAQEALVAEYLVKAEWLKLFARNLGRPAGGGTNSACRVLVVGRLPKGGKEQMRARLEQAEATGSTPLNVAFLDRASAREVSDCDVLFVVNDVPGEVAETYFRELDGKPVLTIADRAELVRRGSIMGMRVTRDKNIEIKLSKANATRANVKIDPKFLENIQPVVRYE